MFLVVLFYQQMPLFRAFEETEGASFNPMRLPKKPTYRYLTFVA